MNANGRERAPGLFGGLTQIGLEEVSLESSTVDSELELPAALTANPAAIFDLGALRGRIEQGQLADLVPCSGDPLEVTSIADQVRIAGQAVEMRSRQTELRDRYPQRLRSN